MSAVYNKKIIINELAIFLLLILLMYANYPVISVLWNKWAVADFTGQFGHGPLLVLIAAWMIYKEHGYKIYEKNTKINISVLLLFIVSIFALFVFRLLSINVLAQIFFLISLIFFFGFFCTFELVKRTKYAWLLLTLALPIWTFLNVPLQFIALHTTNLLLSITTIPYYTEGYLFYLPNGIFEIAESCSGLQQYLVSMILGLVYAYQHNLHFLRALRLLVYLSIFAVIINAIRIFVIVIIGYNTEMRSSLVEDHFTLGWVIYGIGILVFFVIYSRVSLRVETKRIEISEQDTSTAMLVTNWNVVLVSFFVILSPYVAGKFLYAYFSGKNYDNLSFKLSASQTPHQINKNFKALFTEQSFAQQSINKQVHISGRVLDINITRYTHIDDSVDPISEYTRFYDTRYWKQNSKENINLKNSNGKLYKISKSILLAKDGQKRLVYKWYDIDGKRTSDAMLAKLFLLSAIINLKYDVKIIALATEITDDYESAESFLTGRAQELIYE